MVDKLRASVEGRQLDENLSIANDLELCPSITSSYKDGVLQLSSSDEPVCVEWRCQEHERQRHKDICFVRSDSLIGLGRKAS